MKKFAKIMALALVAIMLCTALVSCGKKLSGEYEATFLGSGIVLEFKGNKVTYTAKAAGAEVASVEGTYKIEDDKITLTFEAEKDSEEKAAEEMSGTFDFEEGEDYIKIGTWGKFEKVEEEK